MTYISGFVVPVKTADKAAYRDHAARAVPLLKEFGALSMVEAWGEDVREGKQTDFLRAVNATADETVVFSWIVWPDRATADAAEARMQSDPRMAELGEMPFDGARMILGGFATLLDSEA